MITHRLWEHELFNRPFFSQFDGFDVWKLFKAVSEKHVVSLGHRIVKGVDCGVTVFV